MLAQLTVSKTLPASAQLLVLLPKNKQGTL